MIYHVATQLLQISQLSALVCLETALVVYAHGHHDASEVDRFDLRIHPKLSLATAEGEQGTSDRAVWQKQAL